ncbi:FAD-binding protein [Pseudonocardia benzenivorans]
MEFVEPSFGASVDGDGPPRLLLAQQEGAVVVNSSGDRFVDERADIKELGRACAAQPDGLAFQVFDQDVMNRSRATPAPRDFASALAAGLVRTAPTIDSLAGDLDLPVGALEASLVGFREGLDPTDRRSRLLTPPYYAFRCRAGLSSTYGGIRVDGRLRPVTPDGTPVPGLFAAGEVVGGFHGAGYINGSALGKAAVFGRVAGLGAAAGAGHV